MDLPVMNSGDRKTQYRIKAKNLSYRLRLRESKLGRFGWWEEPHNRNKYILRNVSCEAKPGEVTAIAGPSGAGKTTLLDILAGMITRVSGHVLVNDQLMNAAHFRRVSGYVTQDEALFPLLTVEETLMFSARLRLQGGLHKAATRVRELMKELGLEHVARMRIGTESRRGISGGEKRRVSIGVDLVHNPNVVMIDEATSGLDSASALHVVSLLKSMAKNQGKTIVLTIHQPGFRILELFDNIVLLSNGILLHHGSLQLLEERLKFSGHCIPRHVNVLEFAIDVVESLKIDTEGDDTETNETEEEYRHLRKIFSLGNEVETQTIYPNSRFVEVFILSQRFYKNVFRTKQLFTARVLQSLIAGILLGTVFMNVNNDPKKFKLQTQLGFFAFSLTFLLSPTTEALPIFLEERRILMRETSRGAYRVSSYVIATTTVFLPFLLIVALLYTIPVYWLVGLRRDFNGFLYFSLVVWLVVLMSNSFVTCFGALVPNFIMGAPLIAGTMGSFFLFSGYFISKDDISRCWIFVYYLSLFRYPFECFIINEYGGEKGKGRCLESVGGDCLLDGNGFLMQQGLNETQKWSNLTVMLTFILGYRILCFLILWYRSSRMRS
ncbi:ABC transporter G family member 10-like [Rhododendron vialii]|uniref:ABC transporter G family member 10-like n=1 Tax=Rhododendron vialii TaxID=182163 RepID=UPI00265D6630|nr:ABC transporter G family member 10-like [Rhododendron vialii]